MEKTDVITTKLLDHLNPHEKIDALNALAWELRYDDIPRAIELSEAARDLANQGEPYQKGLLESLRNLGHCHERLNNYELALSLLLEALSLAEATANLAEQATVLYLTGGTYWSLGNYFDALDCELKAIELCETVGDQLGLGKALNIIGLVYHSIGDYGEALDYFAQSLRVFREIGFKRGQGDALSNSSEAYFELGEYDQALATAYESLRIHEEINYKRDLGIVLAAVGRAYLALETYPQALEALQQALAVSREAGNRYAELTALLYLGDAHNRLQESQIALPFLQQALAITLELEVQQERYQCFHILTDLYKQEGDFEKALAAYEQFYSVKENVLDEIARHKLKILEVAHQAEAQRLKSIELEEISNLLNGVIENLPAMLFMKDAETLRFTHFNKAAEDLVGYSRDDLFGKTDHDFFPKEQADFFVATDREVLARGQLVDIVEEPIQTLHQGVRWLYTRKVPLLDTSGQPKYLLGVSIDITELKQAEEALLIQQKRLRSLYEITTQPEQEVDQQFKMALEAGAILLDLDSGIISQIEDDNYTVIHCYAPSDPLQPGQTFELGQTYCDLTFKADQVIGIDHAGQSEYSGHPCYRALQLEAYLGVPLWVNGQRFGTLNFSSLSPRKTPFNEADQDFVRLMGQWVSATLEREQAALALAQARDQALEASRLKSQLLARVSHELRNPLSAILGYAELLENSVFGPLSDPQLKATTHIIDGTYYLTHLVNELLDQAQFESGKITLAINPFDLMDMVNQVENKMTVLARAKGLTFSMDIAADLPSTLVGDQKRLQQILINLIGNAIKFTKSGGVQAHLYRADPAYWTIQVTDTGIGIPPEIQPYIFEPFHQGDGSITREYGGSGLGLAIVKQLVALMNGDVTLESEIGQGSIFTVTLPF